MTPDETSIADIRISISRFAFKPKTIDGVTCLPSGPGSRTTGRASSFGMKNNLEPAQPEDLPCKVKALLLAKKTLASPSMKRLKQCDDIDGAALEKGKSRISPKKKRGYASPDVYAHLNFLQDYFKEDADGQRAKLLWYHHACIF